MSIRLVGLGAMSAPRRRRRGVNINWCLLAWGVFGLALWVPLVVIALWLGGRL